MIEVYLAEAKARKIRLYVFLILGAVALAFLLMLLAKSLGESSRSSGEGQKFEAINQEPVSQDLTAPRPPSSSLDRGKSQDERQLYQDQSEFKEAFFSKLKSYEKTIKPKAALYETLALDQDFKAVMTEAEQEAAGLAGRGRYKDASESLARLVDWMKQRVSKEKSKLDKILTDVREHWRNKEIDLLASSITAARLISPEHKDIQRFSDLAKDWPKVGKLLRESLRYENNGDPGRALHSLKEVKSLSNDVENLDSRIQALQVTKAKVTERNLVESLFSSLNSSDLSESAAIIEELRRRSVLESKYSHLLEEFQKKKYEYDLIKARSNLEQASREERWGEAMRILNDHSSKFDEDQQFRSQAALVQTIHAQLKDFDSVLSRPKELTSTSVRIRVHRLLEQAARNVKVSKKLETKSEQVGALLSKYRTKVLVTILSDAQTHVEVKSVGRVGETKEKTIELLPGTYIFIGKRSGYVSKQVELEVLPLTPVQVKVITDEPI